MPQLWELQPSVQVQGSPSVRETLPDGSGWGDEYIYHVSRPQRTVTLKGRGFSKDEAEDVEASALARNSTYSAEASNGETYTGLLVSETHEQIEGTDLYEVTIQIRRAVT